MKVKQILYKYCPDGNGVDEEVEVELTEEQIEQSEKHKKHIRYNELNNWFKNYILEEKLLELCGGSDSSAALGDLHAEAVEKAAELRAIREELNAQN